MNKHITQTALLGTGTGRLHTAHFPNELQDSLALIRAQGGDAEELFYRSAGLAFAYEHATRLPEWGEDCLRPSVAPAEQRPYAEGALLDYFLHLISLGRDLELYAYLRLEGAGFILPPTQLPTLVDALARENNPTLRYYMKQVGGERFRWMLPLVEHTSVGSSVRNKKLGVKATFGEICAGLKILRRRAPHEARKQIEELCSELPAQQRGALVDCLSVGLSLEDEEFLERLLAEDKASSVCGKASKLLRGMPGSRRNQVLGKILSEHLSYIRKEVSQAGVWGRLRSLMGKSNSPEGQWHYRELAYTERLESLGITTSTPEEGAVPQRDILRQVASNMGLSWWAELLGKSPEEACRLLIEQPPYPEYLEDMELTALRLEDSAWALWILRAKRGDCLYIEPLIALIPMDERENIFHQANEEEWVVPDSWLDPSLGRWGPHFSQLVLTLALNKCELDEKLITRLAECLHPSMMELMRDLWRSWDKKYELDGLLGQNTKFGYLYSQLNKMVELDRIIDETQQRIKLRQQ